MIARRLSRKSMPAAAGHSRVEAFFGAPTNDQPSGR
jgi:hypothetical protein